jgi:hypothetical protein
MRYVGMYSGIICFEWKKPELLLVVLDVNANAKNEDTKLARQSPSPSRRPAPRTRKKGREGHREEKEKALDPINPKLNPSRSVIQVLHPSLRRFSCCSHEKSQKKNPKALVILVFAISLASPERNTNRRSRSRHDRAHRYSACSARSRSAARP